MIRLPVRRAVRLPGALLLTAATLAAGGCTTLGTNVSGKFACEGPEGICAPSTSIDDGAIASIETTSTELLDPAGPYQIDEGYGVPVAPVVAATAAPPSPQADSRYTLRVVFPAFIDGAGQLHERAAVETSVQLPGRGDTVTALALRGSGSGRQGLLAAAEKAPSLLALAAPAAPVPAPVAASASPGTEPGHVPATEAMAIAAAPDPVARIRDQVQTALNAEHPRQQAASFPGTPE